MTAAAAADTEAGGATGLPSQDTLLRTAATAAAEGAALETTTQTAAAAAEPAAPALAEVLLQPEAALSA